MRNALLTIVKVTPNELSHGVGYSFMLQYRVEQGKILMNGYLEAGVTLDAAQGVSDSLRLNANTVVFDDGQGPNAEVSPVVKAGKIKALAGILDIMEINGSIRLGKLKELTGLMDDDIMVFVSDKPRRTRQPMEHSAEREDIAQRIAHSVSGLMARYRMTTLTFNYYKGNVHVLQANGHNTSNPNELVTDLFLTALKRLINSLNTRLMAGGFNAQIAFSGDSVIQTEEGDYIIPVYMSETA